MQRIHSKSCSLAKTRSDSAIFPILMILFIVTSNSFAAQSVQDLIIHESEGLRVLRAPWSNLEDWCKLASYSVPYDVYVFYDVPHEQRLSLLGKSYEAFAQDKVVPAIHAKCGQDSATYMVAASMYGEGAKFEANVSTDELTKVISIQAWDTINFVIEETGVQATGYIPAQAKNDLTAQQLIAITPKRVLAAQQESWENYLNTKVQRLWGVDESLECVGSFCDLPGGLYLNAIYNNDIALIKKIDLNFNNVELVKALNNNFNSKSHYISLLYYVSDYYMYHPRPRGFNPFSMICKEDLVTKYKSDTVPHDPSDNFGTDVTISTTYVVKRNFASLCDRVCSASGGSQHIATQFLVSKYDAIANTLDGAVQLRTDTKYCKDPELGRSLDVFERNLISLTNQFLDNKSTWFDDGEYD